MNHALLNGGEHFDAEQQGQRNDEDAKKPDHVKSLMLNELTGLFVFKKQGYGAGDGNRTHVICLGSKSPAIERHPRCAQL